jgi:hypothetical protein
MSLRFEPASRRQGDAVRNESPEGLVLICSRFGFRSSCFVAAAPEHESNAASPWVVGGEALASDW